MKSTNGMKFAVGAAVRLALIASLAGVGCSENTAAEAPTPCVGNAPDCVPCASGEYRCDGPVLSVCQADGQGFDAVMSCVSEPLCVKGLAGKACASPECNEADTKCDGAKMVVCAAGRDKLEITECLSVAACTAGLKDGKCAHAECSIATECSGTDTECHKRTCSAGVCGTQDSTAGTVCESNRQCDGAGQCVGECNVASDCSGADTECHKRTCSAGVCGTQDSTAGTVCESNRHCDGAGQCVGECNVAADCAGQDTDCRKRTCTSGVCGVQDLAPGAILGNQVEGDCKRLICDGAGGVTTEPQPTDIPVDGNDCTVKVCQGSTPKVTWAALGDACNGTGVCNGAGTCVGCVAGQKQCTTGNALQTCQPNGAWDLGTACSASACVNGACVGGCVPATKQCNVQAPQTCDANGAWQGATTCSASACVSGACVGSCVPGATNCSGNTVLTCDADGTWPAAGAACSNNACVSGACIGVCVPGAKQCSGQNAQTCDANGAWQTTQTCGALSMCLANVCIPIRSCDGLAANCGPTSNENCCSSALVPGGSYLMGRGSGTDACPSGMTCDTGEQPEHTATIAGFRLDLYEVTVGRFRKFVDAYPGSKPLVGAGANPSVAGTGWDTAWASALAADQAALKTGVNCDATYQTWRDTAGTTETLAMNCVNWAEAFAFCAWDGGWLPTEAEWEKASAGGDENRLYPWGAAAPTASLAMYGGSTFASLLAVGSKPLGKGRWGQYDLVGGMWERVFDFYDAAWYGGAGGTCTNCANVTIATYRVLRGGAWFNDAAYLRAAYRHNCAPADRSGGLGFRCARSAP